MLWPSPFMFAKIDNIEIVAEEFPLVFLFIVFQVLTRSRQLEQTECVEQDLACRVIRLDRPASLAIVETDD
jgi:hypothetical protein